MSYLKAIFIVVLCILFLVIIGCESAQKGFDMAVKANSEQAWRDFINSHAEHPLSKEGKKRLELIVFESVIHSNDQKALLDFLKEFPGGVKYGEAKKKLEEVAFEATCTAGTIEAYEDFVWRFPVSEKNLPKE